VEVTRFKLVEIIRKRIQIEKTLTLEEFNGIMRLVDAGVDGLNANKDIPNCVTIVALEMALLQLYNEDKNKKQLTSVLINASSDMNAQNWTVKVAEKKEAATHTLLDLFERVRKSRLDRRRTLGTVHPALGSTSIELPDDNSSNDLDTPLQDSYAWTKTGKKSRDGLSDEQRERMVEAVLNNIPIDYDLVYFFHQEDMPLLLHVIGFRQGVWVMGTGIYMCGNGDAGLTFQGESNVMMSAAAQRKTCILHYTTYVKSIVFHPEAVLHNMNIISQRYIRGNGHTFWDPLNPDHLMLYRGGEGKYDILAFAMPPTPWHSPIKLDMTGRYDPRHDSMQDETDPLHFETAENYCRLWGITHSNSLGLFPDRWDPNPIIRGSTMAFRAHQWVYGSTPSRDASAGPLGRPVIETSHWGPNIYPGVGKTRNLETTDYIRECGYGS
jgi:hypothetical protein